MLKSMLKSGLRKLGYQMGRYVEPEYEYEPLERSLRHLCQGKAEHVIFDVGAHVGHTENQLRKMFPDATIHCFEPFPESFDVLKTSVSGRSFAHNFGLAETVGPRTFQSNPMAATNSLLPLEESAAATWELNALKSGVEIECHFETIDEFMKSNAIKQLDILKIDTQGTEYLVLEGAKTALSSKSIKNIYLEIINAPTYVGQKDFPFYVDLFDGLGFRLFGLYDNWHGSTGELLQLDALFTLK